MSWIYRRPDRETKSSRPPLDVRERSRLAARGAIPLIAFFWMKEQTIGPAGPAAAFAVSAAIAAEAAISLLWLPSSPPAERIYTRTKRGAALLNGALAVAAFIIAAVALQRLT